MEIGAFCLNTFAINVVCSSIFVNCCNYSSCRKIASSLIYTIVILCNFVTIITCWFKLLGINEIVNFVLLIILDHYELTYSPPSNPDTW